MEWLLITAFLVLWLLPELLSIPFHLALKALTSKRSTGSDEGEE